MTGKPFNILVNSNICGWLPVALKGMQKKLCKWINFFMRPCSPIRCGVIGSRIPNMEILMNLSPPYSAYGISYRGIKCTSFPISIPVVINMRLNADSHIDKNPKVCENLG